MKRNYVSGVSNDVTYFTGIEIERTPAYGKQTLFVSGAQDVDDIAKQLSSTSVAIDHIFFGANHSYNPVNHDEAIAWDSMIKFFLDRDYLCSLDIPIEQAENFLDSGLCEYNNFIPQLRVPIPYIKLWNYNTMIKIDDINFDTTNPGVWTHSLHTLMDRKVFTDWSQYQNDTIIK